MSKRQNHLRVTSTQSVAQAIHAATQHSFLGVTT